MNIQAIQGNKTRMQSSQMIQRDVWTFVLTNILGKKLIKMFIWGLIR